MRVTVRLILIEAHLKKANWLTLRRLRRQEHLTILDISGMSTIELRDRGKHHCSTPIKKELDPPRRKAVAGQLRPNRTARNSQIRRVSRRRRLSLLQECLQLILY